MTWESLFVVFMDHDVSHSTNKSGNQSKKRRNNWSLLFQRNSMNTCVLIQRMKTGLTS